jgi:hypothetical protein
LYDSHWILLLSPSDIHQGENTGLMLMNLMFWEISIEHLSISIL